MVWVSSLPEPVSVRQIINLSEVIRHSSHKLHTILKCFLLHSSSQYVNTYPISFPSSLDQLTGKQSKVIQNTTTVQLGDQSDSTQYAPIYKVFWISILSIQSIIFLFVAYVLLHEIYCGDIIHRPQQILLCAINEIQIKRSSFVIGDKSLA